MKRALASILLLLAGLSPALPQSAPANMGYHTIYGRLGATPGDTGPGQALTFDQLASNLFSSGNVTPTLRILKLLSTSGNLTTLTTDLNAGTQTIHMPASTGSLLALLTPQYVGAKCNGTFNDTTILQSAINNLPAYGGVIYTPPGSICLVSGGIVIPAGKNVTLLGVSNKDETVATPSRWIFTGTGSGRFIDFRSGRGLRVENMDISYSSSSFTGKLIDISGTTPGSTVGAYVTIRNSRIGTGDDRTGTATLIYTGGTVDLLLEKSYFFHGFPVIAGQATIGQNVRATIRENTFVKSDAIPINGCGESWILSGNSFEALADGTAGAFTNTPTLYCKAMTWTGNWFGDVTVAGGTWITGTFQGFNFTGNQIAGDLGSATTGISLIGSSGVNIGGGNRFELMNTAINCGSSTANDGVTISNNKFVSVTTKIGNTSNCTNITAEGNSPSTSLATAGQIPVGQSSADIAPKTMSGDATLAASGALTLGTVNSNVGSFGDGTHVGSFTVDGKGRITAASSVVITGAAPTGSAGGDLTGTYPNPTLAAIISVGGPTGSATVAPIVTYDAKGRLTAVSSATITPAIGSVTGLATGCPTWLATATSANLRGCLTDETGTGAAYFQGGDIGTPSAGVLTNVTGLPTAGLLDAAVTYSKIQNVAGLSLFGRSASSAGVGAAITPGDVKQVMRVDTGGTTIGWGSIDLSYSGVVGTSILPLANGGTNAALTASNGGILYSTASAGAILSGTATARQMLQSGATAAPAWSTTTWPATTTINRLLYSSAANVISDLATANSSVLVTDGSGVPSLSTTLPAHTLGGTISGGGNQINNVIIGTSTPLAGTFTTLVGNTSISSPIHAASGAMTFQSNGSTFAGSISTGQQWFMGATSNTPPANAVLTLSKNTAALPATSLSSTALQIGGADGTTGPGIALQAFNNSAPGGQGSVVYLKSRGTAAAPEASQSGDLLGSNFAYGYATSGAAGYVTGAGAGFVMRATDNYTSTVAGAALDLYYTPTGTASLVVGATVQGSGGFNIGATQATLTASEVGMNKITASGSAPGAGTGKLALVAGTSAGTCKLIIYAGTSTTPTTIMDNIGAGC